MVSKVVRADKIDSFVLIIGAMKCGTTSLYQYLSKHPEIAACRTKEVGFFSNLNRYSLGFNFYQNLWNWDNKKHKYGIEASPSYTRVTNPQYANAAENILQTKLASQAKFKFIYLLRNPIDRIESHYTQGRKHGHEDTAKPISEGLQSEIIDTSKYALQIKEYYDRFPAEDILLLELEDLKANPSATLKKICDFLEIDSEYQFSETSIVHNPYSQESSRVFIPGYYFFRKLDFVTTFIRFIPDDIQSKIRSVRNLFAYKFKYEYVKLPPKEKSFLRKELARDINELENKYNFDVKRWKLE